MLVDYNQIFSNGQAITATAVSSGIVDLSGAGSGNATGLITGSAGTFGQDIGRGGGGPQGRPEVYVGIQASFATLTSLQIQLEAAPDNGSNAPGTYYVLAESAVIPVADLTAGSSISLPIPPVPGNRTDFPLPRFLRLNYVVAGSNATAGSVFAALALNSDQMPGYPANTTVAA